MHTTAMTHGRLFIENYWNSGMKNALEIGSQNFNGGLRDFAPTACEYVGLDIEQGPGVDVVSEVGQPLPFEDSNFDIVMASSVFEHDIIFWETFTEMVRVAKPGGLIYINAPSNGLFHRYPVDAFRFYPDASYALLLWAQKTYPELSLVESFVADQGPEVWNDFVAVFCKGKSSTQVRLYELTGSHNVWRDNQFIEETKSELPQDLELIEQLIKKVEELTAQLEISNLSIVELESRLEESSHAYNAVQASTSWKFTRPLRLISKLIKPAGK